jgi:NAD(P)-dependent dehydrogenase (short-subunit alcohol dehydrogenase family)
MKEQISQSYMEHQKEAHASKPYPVDRCAIITGVSKNNIGLAISYELGKCGFLIHPYDKSNGDIRSHQHQRDIIYTARLLDTLILCHGYTRLDWIEHQETKYINDAIYINLVSHIELISIFANESMNLPHRKTIIVIGSMAANAVLNGSAPYCAAKAGLQHFVKCVAWELAPKGFDVYLINPSNVQDTPMTTHTIKELADYRQLSMTEAIDYWSACNPRNEFLTKKEIAKLVSALACNQFPYLSGTPLNLGGGQR